MEKKKKTLGFLQSPCFLYPSSAKSKTEVLPFLVPILHKVKDTNSPLVEARIQKQEENQMLLSLFTETQILHWSSKARSDENQVAMMTEQRFG